MEALTEVQERMESSRRAYEEVRAEMSRIVVGQQELMKQLFIALVCGGHCLLEGVPGLGKTLMVRSLGEVLNLTFSRIQFTPDLMPADITGTHVLTDDPSGKKVFDFQRGPIFANIVLADEINRATPKTQSALLEAMQEQTVTVGGKVHRLGNPFMVLATQNPIEMEGTYPLPEAQIDRFFFKLLIQYPNRQELARIADLTTASPPPPLKKILDAEDVLKIREGVRDVPVAETVRDYAVRLVLATHPESAKGEGSVPMAAKFIHYGSSPRGVQSLILAAKARSLLSGRPNVSFDDIRAAVPFSLCHRIILNLEAEAEGITAEKVVGEVLKEVPELL